MTSYFAQQFKSVIAGQLRTSLNPFLRQPLSDDQFEFQDGVFQLKNLTLKDDIFTEKNLPFKLIHSHIGEIRINLPLLSVVFGGSEVQIEVEDLYLVIGPLPSSDWSAEKVREFAEKRKEKLLEAVEETVKKSIAGQKKGGSSGGSSGGLLGTPDFIKRGLTAWVLKAFKLELRRVHVRYEHHAPPSTGSRFPPPTQRPSFSIGLVLDKIFLGDAGGEGGTAGAGEAQQPPPQSAASESASGVDRVFSSSTALYWRCREDRWLGIRGGDWKSVMRMECDRVARLGRDLRGQAVLLESQLSSPQGLSLQDEFLLPPSDVLVSFAIGKKDGDKILKVASSMPRHQGVFLSQWRLQDIETIGTMVKQYSAFCQQSLVTGPLTTRGRFLVLPHAEREAAKAARRHSDARPAGPLLTSSCRSFLWPNRPAKTPKQGGAPREWWRYAGRCVIVCLQQASPLENWHTPGVWVLLDYHREYLHAYRGVMAGGKNKSKASEMMKKIETKCGVPESLLVLWRRQALGDPALDPYEQKNLGMPSARTVHQDDKSSAAGDGGKADPKAAFRSFCENQGIDTSNMTEEDFASVTGNLEGGDVSFDLEVEELALVIRRMPGNRTIYNFDPEAASGKKIPILADTMHPSLGPSRSKKLRTARHQQVADATCLFRSRVRGFRLSVQAHEQWARVRLSVGSVYTGSEPLIGPLSGMMWGGEYFDWSLSGSKGNAEGVSGNPIGEAAPASPGAPFPADNQSSSFLDVRVAKDSTGDSRGVKINVQVKQPVIFISRSSIRALHYVASASTLYPSSTASAVEFLSCLPELPVSYTPPAVHVVPSPPSKGDPLKISVDVLDTVVILPGQVRRPDVSDEDHHTYLGARPGIDGPALAIYVDCLSLSVSGTGDPKKDPPALPLGVNISRTDVTAWHSCVELLETLRKPQELASLIQESQAASSGSITVHSHTRLSHTALRAQRLLTPIAAVRGLSFVVQPKPGDVLPADPVSNTPSKSLELKAELSVKIESVRSLLGASQTQHLPFVLDHIARALPPLGAHVIRAGRLKILGILPPDPGADGFFWCEVSRPRRQVGDPISGGPSDLPLGCLRVYSGSEDGSGFPEWEIWPLRAKADGDRRLNLRVIRHDQKPPPSYADQTLSGGGEWVTLELLDLPGEGKASEWVRALERQPAPPIPTVLPRRTEWHGCIRFNLSIEKLAGCLLVGSQPLVEGRLLGLGVQFEDTPVRGTTLRLRLRDALVEDLSFPQHDARRFLVCRGEGGKRTAGVIDLHVNLERQAGEIHVQPLTSHLNPIVIKNSLSCVTALLQSTKMQSDMSAVLAALAETPQRQTPHPRPEAREQRREALKGGGAIELSVGPSSLILISVQGREILTAETGRVEAVLGPNKSRLRVAGVCCRCASTEPLFVAPWTPVFPSSPEKDGGKKKAAQAQPEGSAWLSVDFFKVPIPFSRGNKLQARDLPESKEVDDLQPRLKAVFPDVRTLFMLNIESKHSKVEAAPRDLSPLVSFLSDLGSAFSYLSLPPRRPPDKHGEAAVAVTGGSGEDGEEEGLSPQSVSKENKKQAANAKEAKKEETSNKRMEKGSSVFFHVTACIRLPVVALPWPVEGETGPRFFFSPGVLTASSKLEQNTPLPPQEFQNDLDIRALSAPPQEPERFLKRKKEREEREAKKQKAAGGTKTEGSLVAGSVSQPPPPSRPASPQKQKPLTAQTKKGPALRVEVTLAQGSAWLALPRSKSAAAAAGKGGPKGDVAAPVSKGADAGGGEEQGSWTDQIACWFSGGPRKTDVDRERRLMEQHTEAAATEQERLRSAGEVIEWEWRQAAGEFHLAVTVLANLKKETRKEKGQSAKAKVKDSEERLALEIQEGLEFAHLFVHVKSNVWGLAVPRQALSSMRLHVEALAKLSPAFSLPKNPIPPATPEELLSDAEALEDAARAERGTAAVSLLKWSGFVREKGTEGEESLIRGVAVCVRIGGSDLRALDGTGRVVLRAGVRQVEVDVVSVAGVTRVRASEVFVEEGLSSSAEPQRVVAVLGNAPPSPEKSQTGTNKPQSEGGPQLEERPAFILHSAPVCHDPVPLEQGGGPPSSTAKVQGGGGPSLPGGGDGKGEKWMPPSLVPSEVSTRVLVAPLDVLVDLRLLAALKLFLLPPVPHSDVIRSSAAAAKILSADEGGADFPSALSEGPRDFEERAGWLAERFSVLVLEERRRVAAEQAAAAARAAKSRSLFLSLFSGGGVSSETPEERAERAREAERRAEQRRRAVDREALPTGTEVVAGTLKDLRSGGQLRLFSLSKHSFSVMLENPRVALVCRSGARAVSQGAVCVSGEAWGLSAERRERMDVVGRKFEKTSVSVAAKIEVDAFGVEIFRDAAHLAPNSSPHILTPTESAVSIDISTLLPEPLSSILDRHPCGPVPRSAQTGGTAEGGSPIGVTQPSPRSLKDERADLPTDVTIRVRTEDSTLTLDYSDLRDLAAAADVVLSVTHSDHLGPAVRQRDQPAGSEGGDRASLVMDCFDDWPAVETTAAEFASRIPPAFCPSLLDRHAFPLEGPALRDPKVAAKFRNAPPLPSPPTASPPSHPPGVTVTARIGKLTILLVDNVKEHQPHLLMKTIVGPTAVLVKPLALEVPFGGVLGSLAEKEDPLPTSPRGARGDGARRLSGAIAPITVPDEPLPPPESPGAAELDVVSSGDVRGAGGDRGGPPLTMAEGAERRPLTTLRTGMKSSLSVSILSSQSGSWQPLVEEHKMRAKVALEKGTTEVVIDTDGTRPQVVVSSLQLRTLARFASDAQADWRASETQRGRLRAELSAFAALRSGPSGMGGSPSPSAALSEAGSLSSVLSFCAPSPHIFSVLDQRSVAERLAPLAEDERRKLRERVEAARKKATAAKQKRKQQNTGSPGKVTKKQEKARKRWEKARADWRKAKPASQTAPPESATSAAASPATGGGLQLPGAATGGPTVYRYTGAAADHDIGTPAVAAKQQQAQRKAQQAQGPGMQTNVVPGAGALVSGSDSSGKAASPGSSDFAEIVEGSGLGGWLGSGLRDFPVVLANRSACPLIVTVLPREGVPKGPEMRVIRERHVGFFGRVSYTEREVPSTDSTSFNFSGRSFFVAPGKDAGLPSVLFNHQGSVSPGPRPFLVSIHVLQPHLTTPEAIKTALGSVKKTPENPPTAGGASGGKGGKGGKKEEASGSSTSSCFGDLLSQVVGLQQSESSPLSILAVPKVNVNRTCLPKPLQPTEGGGMSTRLYGTPFVYSAVKDEGTGTSRIFACVYATGLQVLNATPLPLLLRQPLNVAGSGEPLVSEFALMPRGGGTGLIPSVVNGNMDESVELSVLEEALPPVVLQKHGAGRRLKFTEKIRSQKAAATAEADKDESTEPTCHCLLEPSGSLSGFFLCTERREKEVCLPGSTAEEWKMTSTTVVVKPPLRLNNSLPVPLKVCISSSKPQKGSPSPPPTQQPAHSTSTFRVVMPYRTIPIFDISCDDQIWVSAGAFHLPLSAPQLLWNPKKKTPDAEKAPVVKKGRKSDISGEGRGLVYMFACEEGPSSCCVFESLVVPGTGGGSEGVLMTFRSPAAVINRSPLMLRVNHKVESHLKPLLVPQESAAGGGAGQKPHAAVPESVWAAGQTPFLLPSKQIRLGAFDVQQRKYLVATSPLDLPKGSKIGIPHRTGPHDLSVSVSRITLPPLGTGTPNHQLLFSPDIHSLLPPPYTVSLVAVLPQLVVVNCTAQPLELAQACLATDFPTANSPPTFSVGPGRQALFSYPEPSAGRSLCVRIFQHGAPKSPTAPLSPGKTAATQAATAPTADAKQKKYNRWFANAPAKQPGGVPTSPGRGSAGSGAAPPPPNRFLWTYGLHVGDPSHMQPVLPLLARGASQKPPATGEAVDVVGALRATLASDGSGVAHLILQPEREALVHFENQICPLSPEKVDSPSVRVRAVGMGSGGAVEGYGAPLFLLPGEGKPFWWPQKTLMSAEGDLMVEVCVDGGTWTLYDPGVVNQLTTIYGEGGRSFFLYTRMEGTTVVATISETDPRPSDTIAREATAKRESRRERANRKAAENLRQAPDLMLPGRSLGILFLDLRVPAVELSVVSPLEEVLHSRAKDIRLSVLSQQTLSTPQGEGVEREEGLSAGRVQSLFGSTSIRFAVGSMHMDHFHEKSLFPVLVRPLRREDLSAPLLSVLAVLPSSRSAYAEAAPFAVFFGRARLSSGEKGHGEGGGGGAGGKVSRSSGVKWWEVSGAVQGVGGGGNLTEIEELVLNLGDTEVSIDVQAFASSLIPFVRHLAGGLSGAGSGGLQALPTFPALPPAPLPPPTSASVGKGGIPRLWLHSLRAGAWQASVTVSSGNVESLLASAGGGGDAEGAAAWGVLNFLGALGDVSNLDLQGRRFAVQEVFGTGPAVGAAVFDSVWSAWWPAFVPLMAGADTLGGPGALVGHLGVGVQDLVAQPAEHPDGVIQGVVTGAGSFARHTVRGAADVAVKLTGGLARVTAALTGDTAYQERVREATLAGNMPRSADGRSAGGGMQGSASRMGGDMVEGLRGVIERPREGAQRGGVAGMMTGIGRGLAGLVLKPVAGVLQFGHAALEGVRSATDIPLVERYVDRFNQLRRPRAVFSCRQGGKGFAGGADREADGGWVSAFEEEDADMFVIVQTALKTREEDRRKARGGGGSVKVSLEELPGVAALCPQRLDAHGRPLAEPNAPLTGIVAVCGMEIGVFHPSSSRPSLTIPIGSVSAVSLSDPDEEGRRGENEPTGSGDGGASPGVVGSNEELARTLRAGGAGSDEAAACKQKGVATLVVQWSIPSGTNPVPKEDKIPCSSYRKAEEIVRAVSCLVDL